MTDSAEFVGGLSVTFDGVNWSSPISELESPYIGVVYGVDTNPLFSVLKTPFTSTSGQKGLSTYYFGEVPLSGSTLTGYPIFEVSIQMQRGVQANSFKGSIIGNSLEVTARS